MCVYATYSMQILRVPSEHLKDFIINYLTLLQGLPVVSVSSILMLHMGKLKQKEIKLFVQGISICSGAENRTIYLTDLM